MTYGTPLNQWNMDNTPAAPKGFRGPTEEFARSVAHVAHQHSTLALAEEKGGLSGNAQYTG